MKKQVENMMQLSKQSAIVRMKPRPCDPTVYFMEDGSRYCLIPTSNGRSAKVSPEDFLKTSCLKWAISKRKHTLYAHRNSSSLFGLARTTLHRFIVDAEESQVVDHVNGDGLDCRRENLRACTPSQNAANRKTPSKNKWGFKGITRGGARTRQYGNVYHAWVTHKGKKYGSCGHPTPEKAAKAYDKMARKFFGKFAQLNFLVLIVLLLNGCVSQQYFQRKVREARDAETQRALLLAEQVRGKRMTANEMIRFLEEGKP